jgi:hypothetical protein
MAGDLLLLLQESRRGRLACRYEILNGQILPGRDDVLEV